MFGAARSFSCRQLPSALTSVAPMGPATRIQYIFSYTFSVSQNVFLQFKRAASFSDCIPFFFLNLFVAVVFFLHYTWWFSRFLFCFVYKLILLDHASVHFCTLPAETVLFWHYHKSSCQTVVHLFIQRNQPALLQVKAASAALLCDPSPLPGRNKKNLCMLHLVTPTVLLQ